MTRNKIKYVLVLMLILSVSIFAGNKNLEEKYKTIEDNLLVGLQTDNLGLKVSAAYFLGEMKSERAVIPLMKMLKGNTTEEEKLIAALSLAKIKSEKGMFAVKQRIKFDDSKRVQRLCDIFYNNYLFENIEGNVIVEPFDFADLNIEYRGIKLSQFVK
jgi:HEAT repeat protein